MADRGIDAGGDGVDLHVDGVQTTVQSGEAFTCAVLVVPWEDVWDLSQRDCVWHVYQQDVHSYVKTHILQKKKHLVSIWTTNDFIAFGKCPD